LSASIAREVIPVSIVDEMRTSYIRYAMSVIVSRALPDVRDGLKPVQRRILYAMYEQRMFPDRPREKCAAVVGEVMKKYHPHGDAPIYDALVRMAQDFNTRYPLIDGHGNFGSIDGDPPAAMRYTECRLSPIAMAMLEDIDKDTVDLRPNYDEKYLEPVVLPSKIPNLLINGATGIAVAMATNIPPHNLGEVIDALILLIDNPDASLEEIMNVLPGPDFPTGGIVLGAKGLKEAYATGKGMITIQGRASIEALEGGRTGIVITELPYQVSKEALIVQIANLVRDKKLEGVVNVNDETDKTGMRIVIELRRDANAKVILNKLYKHTSLRTSYGIIMLALVDNQPKILTLKEMLLHFLEHRKQVVRRRTEFELRRAEARAHIVEGLRVVAQNIDEAIRLIRKSEDRDDARQRLMRQFKLSEQQANAVLDMPLGRLTRLDQQALKDEYRELIKQIEYLRGLLRHPRQLMEVIKEELKSVKNTFKDPRRTMLIPEEPSEASIEDLIELQDLVITITRDGYIKRVPLSTYKVQKRGGKGVLALTKKEEDTVSHIFVATTHHTILFFTNKGKCYQLKAHEVPVASRQARGTPIVNLIQLDDDERVVATVPIAKFEVGGYLFMCTKMGLVKKTPLEQFQTRLSRGVQAIKLDEGDELCWVRWTDGSREIILATAGGMIIRFSEEEVRPMGRQAGGVRGIKLRPNDFVVAMDIVDEDANDMLLVTEKGFGKRTKLQQVKRIGRGGKGVIGIKVSERNGRLVSLHIVRDDDEVLLITSKGVLIRQRVKSIPISGRAAQGIRLMRLDADDRVATTALVVSSNNSHTHEGDSDGGEEKV